MFGSSSKSLNQRRRGNSRAAKVSTASVIALILALSMMFTFGVWFGSNFIGNTVLVEDVRNDPISPLSPFQAKAANQPLRGNGDKISKNTNSMRSDSQNFINKNEIREKPEDSNKALRGHITPSQPVTVLFPYFGDSNLNSVNYEPKGGSRFEEWKDGETPFPITPEVITMSDNLARKRREHIKAGMKHAWNGYKDHAFGHDEVTPLSGTSRDNWGGLGTTLVDSLDTLWLMNMKDEFWEARDWVRDHLSHAKSSSVSVFETTIRSLGGLISAYDWSGDEVFLEKAQDLGDRLLNAFHSPSGIPYGQVNLNSDSSSNIGWTGGSSILSEVGTLQVEFRFLAKASGKKEYAEKVEKAFAELKKIEPNNGLYPYFVSNGNNPHFTNNKLTFGAMSDSFYEYMLKIWIQGGKTEPMYREMYDKSMEGMHNELLQKSDPSGLWYIADKNNGRMDYKMDHLVCFMGGLLALGAYTDPLGLDSDRAQRDLKTGKALTYTCYQMYARMKTGLAPEYITFSKGKDFSPGHVPYYILRPEAVESFFILNKLTGDPIYREFGWEMFQSLEKYSRTNIAYGHVGNVNNIHSKPDDRMESFFLAETMKYLYLLMDPDTEIDILEKHVFNTEAHPTRTFNHFQ